VVAGGCSARPPVTAGHPGPHVGGLRPRLPAGVLCVSGAIALDSRTSSTTTMALRPVQPSQELLAEVAHGSVERRTRGCERPIRLRGSTKLVNPVTGEVRSVYASDQEVDGYAQVPCGNRRAEVCEPCSTRYAGDAWQLIHAGLAGGKGIPQAVAQHASTFGTFTAPSFGPVHGVRDKGPCRARRDKPVCSHGRPLWCNKRHLDGDERVGTPLCVDCYDYLGHVLWQWHAPELWRRTTIALQRELARRCGLSVKAFSRAAKVSYSKIAEFQARRLVHLHVPIRIDGAGGPDGPAPDLPMSTADLEDAVHAAAAHAFVDTTPLSDGTVYRVRWGTQVDTRTITDRAPLDTPSRASRTAAVHPEQVASYLAKYLTKTTTDFGLHGRVLSAAHARAMGASMHAVLILRTAQDLAGEHEDYPCS
jgi:hypothetical protein